MVHHDKSKLRRLRSVPSDLRLTKCQMAEIIDLARVISIETAQPSSIKTLNTYTTVPLLERSLKTAQGIVRKWATRHKRPNKRPVFREGAKKHLLHGVILK